MKQKIIELEEKLRCAMLQNDVEVLDELIDDSLIFLAPMGAVVSKQMDLEAHKAQLQTMSELTPFEQEVQLIGETAVVTVKMCIRGTFAGVSIDGDYRYLRVWRKTNDSYKIISGAVVLIKE